MSESVARTDTEPPEPKDASTVVLVRDGAAGPEIFLQRRVEGMAFAGGMTVFPGGGVDPSDAEAEIAWAGPDPTWWGQRFGVDRARAQALVCAAVRETFEECGVLLAGPTADSVVADSSVHREARGRLERRELSLGRFLAEEKLVLRADLLRPWDNWITPVIERRRYDTYFFVAVLPEGQNADGATSEAREVAWRTPADALARWRAGQDVLLPPTWTQLSTIAEFDSTADILASKRTVTPIQPIVEPGDAGAGTPMLQFPGNERYFADNPDPTRLQGSKRE